MTVSGATEGPVRESADPSTDRLVSRDVLERATVREILMGAQDNLTNVLAVMLGVAGLAALAAAVVGSLIQVA